MITLGEAKKLKSGDVLTDSKGKRWKVNGQVKTWKRDPLRIRVPLKHGLYSYDALTEDDFDRLHYISPDDDSRPVDEIYVCELLTKGE